MINRRAFVGAAAGGAALAVAGVLPGVRKLLAAAVPPAPTPITVYKSPTCGCCSKWVDHLRAHDFVVTAVDLQDVQSIKTKHGVPAALASCHTGVVGGYVVEGHVPADLVRRMLTEKPKIVGIAVPGMPAGSPGMEVSGHGERYEIIAFDKAGKTRVFAKR